MKISVGHRRRTLYVGRSSVARVSLAALLVLFGFLSSLPSRSTGRDRPTDRPQVRKLAAQPLAPARPSDARPPLRFLYSKIRQTNSEIQHRCCALLLALARTLSGYLGVGRRQGAERAPHAAGAGWMAQKYAASAALDYLEVKLR